MKMKKTIKNTLIATMLLGALSLQSCATILGGRVSDCQRTKPNRGEPTRKIRVAALICDVVLTGVVGVGIDFLTGAVYKPCKTKHK